MFLCLLFIKVNLREMGYFFIYINFAVCVLFAATSCSSNNIVTEDQKTIEEKCLKFNSLKKDKEVKEYIKEAKLNQKMFRIVRGRNLTKVPLNIFNQSKKMKIQRHLHQALFYFQAMLVLLTQPPKLTSQNLKFYRY